jgi:hypothetical protein
MNMQKALSIEIEKKIVNDPEFERQLIRDIEKFLAGSTKDKPIPVEKLDREFVNVNPAASRGPNDITAEVLFSGVRFRIPSAALATIGTAIEIGGAVTGFAAVFGPAAAFAGIAVAFMSANYGAARLADRGRGVYLNISWFGNVCAFTAI